MVSRVSYTYTPARLDELMAHLDDFEPRFAQKKRAEWRDQDEAAAVGVEQEERAVYSDHVEVSTLEPIPPKDSWWRRWVSGP